MAFSVETTGKICEEVSRSLITRKLYWIKPNYFNKKLFQKSNISRSKKDFSYGLR